MTQTHLQGQEVISASPCSEGSVFKLWTGYRLEFPLALQKIFCIVGGYL